MPLQWALELHFTQVWLAVLQYGVAGVVEQFGSPRHCTHTLFTAVSQ